MISALGALCAAGSAAGRRRTYHAKDPVQPAGIVPIPRYPAGGDGHLHGTAASGGHGRGVRDTGHHHRPRRGPAPEPAGAPHPGVAGDVRRHHAAAAFSHRGTVRRGTAGDLRRQLRLSAQHAGHRLRPRRAVRGGGGHDRGRRHRHAGGHLHQAHPQAVPAGHHRHGGVHHRPFPVPHGHPLYGRRHRQYLRLRGGGAGPYRGAGLWLVAELGRRGVHADGGAGADQPRKGHLQAGIHSAGHPGGLRGGVHRGDGGPVRHRRGGMVLPAAAASLRHHV